MEALNALLRVTIGLVARLFAWAPPIAGLAVISAAAGVAMLWLFRKTTDPQRIAAVKRRIRAHLMEFRIYGDEPALVWRAQKSLVASNLRYLALMLPSLLSMAFPLSLLLVHLEALYGQIPLPLGQPAVVTVALGAPLDARAPEPALTAPPGVAVETGPVRALDLRQVSWRICPTAAVSGTLRIQIRGSALLKRIETGPPPRFVSARRVRSLFASPWHPGEPLIRNPAVDWVEIAYPTASVDLFGLSCHWLVWFVLIFMLTALLLRRRFGVVF